MTGRQRERIDDGIAVVEGWLHAAKIHEPCLMLDALAAMERYLAGAQTAHGAIVRMTGLVDYLANRCGRLLPERFQQFGTWLVDTTPDGRTIDDESPESRVAIRLMIAHANHNESFAHELLVAYLNALPDRAVRPDHLQDVFFHLAENYLWIDRHQFPHKETHVEHDHRSLATRIVAPWRRMATALTRSRRVQRALSAVRPEPRRERPGRRGRAGTRGRPGAWRR